VPARLGVLALTLMLCVSAIGRGEASGEERALKLYNLHTHEKATIVFKRDGVYDQAGLDKLNEFLRDWRKDKVIEMDPHLFDLVWEVYRESGSHDYINIICGYRSPDTNAMLRRRSKGVAQNSLHMQGKAMDFAIPDVPLATLRVIGLRLQEGGVGFYPTSGSPFVHMDTGNVRHWPRMSRQQLVSVFPNGHTLHIPSDGKPLPGYEQALAAYKARKAAGGDIAVASYSPPTPPTPSIAPGRTAPTVVASAADPDQIQDDIEAAAAPVPVPAPRRAVAVAVASYSTVPAPLPRLAPRDSAPLTLAAAAVPVPAPSHGLDFNAVATTPPMPIVPGIDFGSPQIWSPPAVPAALAAAMAERDHARRAASVPIAPTAVVATIDVSRPLRAEAMTTAVLRKHAAEEPTAQVPTVLAYAPLNVLRVDPAPAAKLSSLVPLPALNPHHDGAATRDVPTARSAASAPRMQAPPLTMTNLDTQGLRLWSGPGSTRQKGFALLTMPDFTQAAALISKPEVTLAAGFGPSPYGTLRTDHFSGPLVAQPAVIDLTDGTLVTASR
jgi:uncharacterized protein YcbK (DUF882 family)